MRRFKKLTTDDKSMNYRWLVSNIAKAIENDPWINKATFYKQN